MHRCMFRNCCLTVVLLITTTALTAATGDHMDPDYRTAVLKSIRELPPNYGADTALTLYASAIKQWDQPSQESDRSKACDGLYLWYWAAPDYKVTKQSFEQCPEAWKQQAFDRYTMSGKLSSDSELSEQLTTVCEDLFFERIYETRSINQEEMFKNCPASWRRSTFHPPDGEYYPIVKVEPIVPMKAIRLCRNGWATVQFDIGTNGSTKNIKVVEASDRMFKKPTIHAVEQWIYQPSRENGESVETVGVLHKAVFKIDPSACN